VGRNILLASVLALAWLGQTGPAGGANVAVLMPGSGGIAPNDFLVQNEGRFRSAGIRTIMTTSPSSTAEAIAAETSQGRKIVIALTRALPQARACHTCLRSPRRRRSSASSGKR
jgi:hypothetical protein